MKKIAPLLLSFLLSLIPQISLALNPYSTRELDQLEKEFIQQINESPDVQRHPLANEYLNRLGQRLSQSTNLKFLRFFIVNSNEINAFAGPGGYIGINSALILATSNESELAGVMAHELAHLSLQHLYRMIQHQKQMKIPMLASLLAAMALGAINPTLGNGAMMASMTGFSQNSINFTRANEKEADRIGINLLIKAGFNPRAMAAFFKKMQQHSRYYYTANLPAILRSHPLDEERIAEADSRSLHLPVKDYPDDLDYHLFKELIRTESNQNPETLLHYYRESCSKQGPKSACDYGRALSFIKLNALSKAKPDLSDLLTQEPKNVFFQLAMVELNLNAKDFKPALERLRELSATYPQSYAILIAYADGLLSANSKDKALSLLLKGSRIFKEDLALCEKLARAYSLNRQKPYAYFTQAKCQLLQGRRFDALKTLKLVKKMTKDKDSYLLSRSEAMMDEIQINN